MDVPVRLSLLENVPLFAGLAPAEKETVAREARERPVRKDEVLFRQGDGAERHYVVGWGRLRLDQATPDGQNVVLRYLGPGDLLASVAVLRGTPLPATATAVEDGMVLYWGAAGVAELMERYPRLATNAIKVIGGRVEELQQRLAELATQRVERRIAAALVRLARQSGRRVEGGVEIPYVVSREDLAEMTGTTLHTVSRTLAAWEQEGIVSGKRAAHIVIAKPHRLVEIAEQV